MFRAMGRWFIRVVKSLWHWINVHAFLAAFLLVTLVFVYTTARFTQVIEQQEDEASKRVKAFCGLVYLFDESLKQSGRTGQLGELQPAYDQWKEDVEATNCPDKTNVAELPPVNSTTTKPG